MSEGDDLAMDDQINLKEKECKSVTEPESEFAIDTKVNRENKESYVQNMRTNNTAELNAKDDTLSAGEINQISVIQLLALANNLLTSEGDFDSALDIFSVAMHNAEEYPVLEARAMRGMAVCYSLCPDRLAASPSMFEIAAQMFLDLGETHDALTNLLDASKTYERIGSYDNAFSVLQTFLRIKPTTNDQNDEHYSQKVAKLILLQQLRQKT